MPSFSDANRVSNLYGNVYKRQRSEPLRGAWNPRNAKPSSPLTRNAVAYSANDLATNPHLPDIRDCRFNVRMAQWINPRTKVKS